MSMIILRVCPYCPDNACRHKPVLFHSPDYIILLTIVVSEHRDRIDYTRGLRLYDQRILLCECRLHTFKGGMWYRPVRECLLYERDNDTGMWSILVSLNTQPIYLPITLCPKWWYVPNTDAVMPAHRMTNSLCDWQAYPVPVGSPPLDDEPHHLSVEWPPLP